MVRAPPKGCARRSGGGGARAFSPRSRCEVTTLRAAATRPRCSRLASTSRPNLRGPRGGCAILRRAILRRAAWTGPARARACCVGCPAWARCERWRSPRPVGAMARSRCSPISRPNPGSALSPPRGSSASSPPTAGALRRDRTQAQASDRRRRGPTPVARRATAAQVRKRAATLHSTSTTTRTAMGCGARVARRPGERLAGRPQRAPLSWSATCSTTWSTTGAQAATFGPTTTPDRLAKRDATATPEPMATVEPLATSDRPAAGDSTTTCGPTVVVDRTAICSATPVRAAIASHDSAGRVVGTQRGPLRLPRRGSRSRLPRPRRLAPRRRAQLHCRSRIAAGARADPHPSIHTGLRAVPGRSLDGPLSPPRQAPLAARLIDALP